MELKINNLCKNDIFINIYEIKNPEINAILIADNITQQIKKRVSFKRIIKRAMGAAQKMDIHGIKIQCSGRLNGAEMSRREWYKSGRVPLQTIRANIDYGFSVANTT